MSKFWPQAFLTNSLDIREPKKSCYQLEYIETPKKQLVKILEVMPKLLMKSTCLGQKNIQLLVTLAPPPPPTTACWLQLNKNSTQKRSSAS